MFLCDLKHGKCIISSEDKYQMEKYVTVYSKKIKKLYVRVCGRLICQST
jgi:hypothetical protein